MRKRWSLLLVLCCISYIFAGCGTQIPDMTEEERKEISEYAAGLLLKYDTSQPSRLVDLDKLEAEAPSKPTQAPEEDETVIVTPAPGESGEQTEESNEPKETPKPDTGEPLESTLLLSDELTVRYVTYEAVKSYADASQGSQEVDASQGKKLLVFSFEIVNNSTETQEIDMLQDNIRYKVYVGDVLCNGMLTMFANDLATYMGDIGAGEVKELKLFAQVKEELLQEANGIYIEFVCGEKISRVIVK